jgi:hypothetical protein
MYDTKCADFLPFINQVLNNIYQLFKYTHSSIQCQSTCYIDKVFMMLKRNYFCNLGLFTCKSFILEGHLKLVLVTRPRLSRKILRNLEDCERKVDGQGYTLNYVFVVYISIGNFCNVSAKILLLFTIESLHSLSSFLPPPSSGTISAS